MHRETEAVLDRELASKQEVLDEAHATLAALHERFTALTQVAPTRPLAHTQAPPCMGCNKPLNIPNHDSATKTQMEM